MTEEELGSSGELKEEENEEENDISSDGVSSGKRSAPTVRCRPPRSLFEDE